MKTELKRIGLVFGLGLLASATSSCSLLGKGKYASQWEIESDVPASLNSGRAGTPSPAAVAGNGVRSDLDGLPPVSEAMLDLPVSENGTIIDIPKPDVMAGGLAYQSPPEMLNVPPAEGAGDLPYTVGSPSGIETLLPAPPPAVTEDELQLSPAADTSAAVAATLTLPPPAELLLSPVPPPSPVTTLAPSIPLLYGKLDLAPFLNPPVPLAVNTPPVPETAAK